MRKASKNKYKETENGWNYDPKYTRWFKYDRDDLGVNKSQFVPVIFEPPCMFILHPVWGLKF
jgi:hypothetical protein